MTDAFAIANAICDFIRKQLVAPETGVMPDTPFEQLGLDSFSLIELVLFLERQYGITLPDHQLTRDNMINAQALADCAVRFLPAAR